MNELSPQQSKAALLLAVGTPCKDVAREVCVTPQTISVWRSDREFQLYVQRLQWDLLRDQQNQLRIEARTWMLNAKSKSIRLRAALANLTGTGVLGQKPQNGRLWRDVDELFPV